MDKNKQPIGFGPTSFGAFMPGQKGLLAQQLNRGFGGGQGQWKGILVQTYDPVTVPGFTYGGGNGNGNGTPDWNKNQQQIIDQYVNNPDPRATNNQDFMNLNPKLREYILAQRLKNPIIGNFGGAG